MPGPETNFPFCLQTTPYGGRGLYATRRIPKDTLLMTCESPYATVIFKKFRKEVCGHCFEYAFDARKNTWNIKHDGPEGSGVWFCTVDCREMWKVEQNVDGLQGLMNAAIEKQAKGMKEPKNHPVPTPVEAMRPENITLALHDLTWKNAEEMYSRPSCPIACLNELELDTVRFIVSAIIRRYFQDRNKLLAGPLSWPALLELQDNEILHIQYRPYMLDSHIRIYGFIRRVLLPVLQPYVKTSEMVRAILAREQGNVFGLWDMATSGDSEMLGWSMYLTGSYFNHDCSPNVRKVRVKKALCFLATTDIEIGEELCTNYVDIEDDVTHRQRELSRNWYFNCGCKRCHKELQTICAIITS